jgi:membrane-associated protein
VTSLSILGYLLGNNEFVKNHFEIVILVVIAISVLPIIIGFLRAKLSKKAA